MSEKTDRRTTEGRSPKEPIEGGSQMTPEAVLAKDAKKGGKA